jgi:hypothetical protein
MTYVWTRMCLQRVRLGYRECGGSLFFLLLVRPESSLTKTFRKLTNLSFSLRCTETANDAS